MNAEEMADRAARVHVWLQGGENRLTPEDRQWIRIFIPELDALCQLREQGPIPLSAAHLAKARKYLEKIGFYAVDLR